ncbi:MAG: hypothetical protein MI810_19235 [Flavobacteriales bacterium]|jgi:hypothetical protein|nr:hypothetical protein [Flavobacteriales bacterium]
MKLNHLLIAMALLSFYSCKKSDEHKTVEELYNTYKYGRISECKHDGETVFSAEMNAYDAPTVVYDAEGNQIGNCNYAWGSVDSICNELEDCEVVYRVEDNIWGQEAVDKYELGD